MRIEHGPGSTTSEPEFSTASLMVELARVIGLEHPATTAQLLALVAARVFPIVFLVPFLGGKLVPALAKLALVIGLTLAMAPAVIASQVDSPPLATSSWVALVVKEAGVGLAIGFLVALVFYAAQMGGDLIDAFRGQSVLFSPASGSGPIGSPTRLFAVLLLIVVFMALDGHHLVISALSESFRILPPTAMPILTDQSAGGLFWGAIDLLGLIWVVALAISLPIAVSSLIVDLSMAVVVRTAPRLNAYFLGLPIKALLGILVLLVALTAVVDVLLFELNRSESWVLWLLEGSGG